MTPYDLVPFALFGALWLGAWKLDRRDARRPLATAGFGTTSESGVPAAMPAFMREFEPR